MAEAGIHESTMTALIAHMCRALLERYSHVGNAKAGAVKALSTPIPSITAVQYSRVSCSLGAGEHSPSGPH
jgi:hypothetical protein